MASEGPNSPGTMADDGAVGTVTWLNPDRAKVSDNSWATASVDFADTTSHYLKATDFGFSIPGGATIDGILVEIERRESAPNVEDSAVKIVKADGSIGAENKASAVEWTSTEAYYSYGGAADLWSEAWAPADINDVDFGVVLSVRLWEGLPAVASVDHIRITVYYTEVVGTNMKVNIADVFKDISEIKINIGDEWKDVTGIKINIGDVWKDVF